MAYQNKIPLGRDNPVAIVFDFSGTFIDLDDFDKITLEIGGETYDTDLNPANIWLEEPLELRLNIGAITSLAVGSYSPTITGYSLTYPNGYELTSPELAILPDIEVV